MYKHKRDNFKYRLFENADFSPKFGMPYFMENEEWYTYDKKTNTYTLTDKAPPKAIESYQEFIQYWGTPYNWFGDMDKESFDRFVDKELERLNNEK